ncbi:hypothetical protein T12_14835 [Trichinella patagoniensis]|uniref:Uncharacterized protein n=1 Tax=Trichinella patagoniensis TaxID=990121 RepID=A0A0V0Z8Z6_9BILA|nr:hypothetical protein T12_14835 [Trichinella patagoniensis]
MSGRLLIRASNSHKVVRSSSKKQALSDHPQCVLDRSNKPLPVSAAPGSSFSGVSSLNAPADQLVPKLLRMFADKNRADERVCLFECPKWITVGVPLPAMKRRSAARKLVVVMLATISRCTARVIMHVKRQM